jgi:hypothetical protein
MMRIALVSRVRSGQADSPAGDHDGQGSGGDPLFARDDNRKWRGSLQEVALDRRILIGLMLRKLDLQI